ASSLSSLLRGVRPMSPFPPAPIPPAPRLLDRVPQAALAHFGRPEPGERCADWTRRFVLFHNKRHPSDMGVAEISHFLEHVAQTEAKALNALEQAHEALTFLDTGGAPGGCGSTVRVPHLSPQFRHAPDRTWRGRAQHSTAARPREPGDDHDLSPC